MSERASERVTSECADTLCMPCVFINQYEAYVRPCVVISVVFVGGVGTTSVLFLVKSKCTTPVSSSRTAVFWPILWYADRSE